MWPSTTLADRAPKRLAALAFAGWMLVGCSEASPSEPAVAEPPPFPGSVATTDWRPEEDPPEGFGPGTAGYTTPRGLLEALLSDVIRQEGLPDGMSMSGGLLEELRDSATAWVYLTGAQDDSVAGGEIRLLMRRAEAGWFIERLSWRDHCRRGVDRASNLCV